MGLTRGMTTDSEPHRPARLASEDVIISAPMSYVGSAQRIMRVRRRAHGESELAALTAAAVIVVGVAWVFVTAWYLTWGLLLVPYRLQRRGARKRKADARSFRRFALFGQSQRTQLFLCGLEPADSVFHFARAHHHFTVTRDLRQDHRSFDQPIAVL